MPRKWTNAYGANSGGSVNHTFTEPAPGRMINGDGYEVDLRLVNQILEHNMQISRREQRKK